ncbi:MAG: TPM domain-containing protein, partial [Giesbergeria sp.]
CLEGSLPLSYLWRNAPPRQRAITLFGKLRVWDTEHNNGVLIYLLLAEQAIEIVADRALARAVPQSVWDALLLRMREPLRAGRFEEALNQTVDEVTLLLELQSAGMKRLPNELPDAPVTSP